jgi:putative phosphoesterase
MKIIVLSDTHGNQSAALGILYENGDADRIVHLGDEVEDACFLEKSSGRSIVKISGNCDFSTNHPREAMLDLAGRRVFVTHGDLYGLGGDRPPHPAFIGWKGVTPRAA